MAPSYPSGKETNLHGKKRKVHILSSLNFLIFFGADSHVALPSSHTRIRKSADLAGALVTPDAATSSPLPTSYALLPAEPQAHVTARDPAVAAARPEPVAIWQPSKWPPRKSVAIRLRQYCDQQRATSAVTFVD